MKTSESLRKLCEARGGDEKRRARTSYRPEETRPLQGNIQNPCRNSPHAPAARATASRYPSPKTAIKHTLPPTGNKSSGLSLREHRLDVLMIKRSIFWHGWVQGKPHFQRCLPPRNVAGWCPSPFTSGDHSPPRLAGSSEPWWNKQVHSWALLVSCSLYVRPLLLYVLCWLRLSVRDEAGPPCAGPACRWPVMGSTREGSLLLQAGKLSRHHSDDWQSRWTRPV